MKLNFCTECGAKLLPETKTDYRCLNGHPFWNNPKASVALILLKKGQVLVAKRGREPKKGLHGFPGGFINYGESPYAAAKRELKEEAGVETDDIELIYGGANIYDENISACDFVFICRSWQGQPKADDDVAELVWQPLKFIESPQFAWDYPGLVAKLEKFKG